MIALASNLAVAVKIRRARAAAPERWVTQHGVSQPFGPLSSDPHDGAPDRYPVAKAEVDARTAAQLLRSWSCARRAAGTSRPRGMQRR